MKKIEIIIFAVLLMFLSTEVAFSQTAETDTISQQDETEVFSMSSEDQSKFVGKYEVQPDFVIVITQKENKLMAYAPDYGNMEMIADDPMNFHVKSMPTSVKFKANENDEITMMVIDHEGQIIPAQKIE